MTQKEAAQRQLGRQQQDITRRSVSIPANSTAIYAGLKIVGQVRGQAFTKSVKASVHMLRRPAAWALDIQSLRDAEALGAQTVQLHDKDTDQVYSSTIAQIWRHGFTFDRGHGQQIGLPLAYWQVHRDGVRQLSLFGVTP